MRSDYGARGNDLPTEWAAQGPYASAVRSAGVGAHSRVPALAAALYFAYFVLVGGTAVGEVDPVIRLINAGIGAVVLITYVARAHTRADRTDQWMLLAVLLFAGAAVFSAFPRQSLDAALTALSYAAALFAARELLADPRTRNLAMVSLLALSVVVTLLTAARWLPLVAEWWSLNNGEAIPPLDLALPSTPWGHRHDLALLVAMLYPSWWIGRPGRFRAVMGIAIGILGLLVVLVDGSRSLWFALALATAVWLGGPLIRRLRSHRSRIVALIVIGIVTAMVIATGAADAAAQRILNTGTLSARFSMWGPLIEAWAERPLTGWGPGSFPWTLQLTDYFDTQTWAPRHPDSVLFQLLPESGLLGVAAVVTVTVGVGRAIARSRHRPASWALVAFAAAGVGANPTDFPFLVAIAIAWTALAIPHTVGPDVRRAQSVSRKTLARGSVSIVALSVLGLMVLATGAGGVMYGAGRSAVSAGEVDAAEMYLSAAIGLDPGMALYWRQRGILRLREGQIDNAVDDLEEAAARSPSDHITWRSLALAYRADGSAGSATAALDRAVDLKRADPTNLLLRARWQLEDSNPRAALETLAEVVQAWPAVVGAPGWLQMLSQASFASADVIAAAADRWEAGLPAPTNDPVLLSVLSGRDDVSDYPQGSGFDVLRSTYRCDAHALPAGSAHDRRSFVYWELRIRVSAWQGHPDVEAQRVLELMTGASSQITDGEGLNVFADNDAVGFGSDVWGYWRAPIAWAFVPVALPSPQAGVVRWRTEPAEATRESGQSFLALCG